MDDDKNKRKAKLSILIGVLVLTILVVGAAYSYYIVNGSNTTTTTAGRVTLQKAGVVSLTQGVSNIYLDVTSSQMSERNSGTDYYGMDTETTAETTPQNHVLATIQATGGEDDTVYQCTMGYSISATQISGSSNDAYAALENEDASLVISTVPSTNSGNYATNIAGSRGLIVQTLVNAVGQGAQGARLVNAPLSETDTSTVIIHGNTSIQIVGELIFHNLNIDQTDIADIGVNVSFGVTSFSCNPIEQAPNR